MTIRFDNQIAIVTGAGNGLGKSHALELARLGAKVVVNDFGGSRDGKGGSSEAAEKVVAEIKKNGGEAIANSADVSNLEQCQQMVETALKKWKRVDVLVNNAGILRDKSFGKMTKECWDSVVNVHLGGSANCCMAVWAAMREQNYGRIMLTTSTSGVYGNFGQTNYGAAKMGMLGIMNNLCIEGSKYNIKINCLCPTAATRMTEDILTPEMLAELDPKYVSPAAAYLVSKEAPNRTVMFAGAGSYSVLDIRESEGCRLPTGQRNVDGIAEHFDKIASMENTDHFVQGTLHIAKLLERVENNK